MLILTRCHCKTHKHKVNGCKPRWMHTRRRVANEMRTQRNQVTMTRDSDPTPGGTEVYPISIPNSNTNQSEKYPLGTQPAVIQGAGCFVGGLAEGINIISGLVEHMTVQFHSQPLNRYLWNSFGLSQRLPGRVNLCHQPGHHAHGYFTVQQ